MPDPYDLAEVVDEVSAIILRKLRAGIETRALRIADPAGLWSYSFTPAGLQLAEGAEGLDFLDHQGRTFGSFGHDDEGSWLMVAQPNGARSSLLATDDLPQVVVDTSPTNDTRSAERPWRPCPRGPPTTRPARVSCTASFGEAHHGTKWRAEGPVDAAGQPAAPAAPVVATVGNRVLCSGLAVGQRGGSGFGRPPKR